MYYNKVDISYEPKNNSINYCKICNTQQTSKRKTLKAIIVIKMVILLCFILSRKVMKEHCEHKMRNMLAHNMYSSTSKDPKELDTKGHKVRM